MKDLRPIAIFTPDFSPSCVHKIRKGAGEIGEHSNLEHGGLSKRQFSDRILLHSTASRSGKTDTWTTQEVIVPGPTCTITTNPGEPAGGDPPVSCALSLTTLTDSDLRRSSNECRTCRPGFRSSHPRTGLPFPFLPRLHWRARQTTDRLPPGCRA